MRIQVNVKMTGRIFSPDAADVIERHAGYAVRELVELGEQRLDEMLRPRPAGVYLSASEARKGKASTGYYRANLHAKSQGLHGRIDDGGVIYGPWLEGVGSRNQTTRFKGYASFRRTGQYLETVAHDVLEKHMQRAADKLNG